MQAIILCAGKSTRTEPLTTTKPKPLLPVINKPLIMHTLDALEGLVDNVIIVVGYKKEMIMKTVGKKYKNLAITYVEQKEQKGTGHAVLQCKKVIFDKSLLIINGDDLYAPEDIKNLTTKKQGALACHVSNPSEYGIFKVNNGILTDLIEKPSKPVGNQANIGCYLVQKDFFEELKNLVPSLRGELEITDAIKTYGKIRKPFHIVDIKKYWYPISYPWKYLEANVNLLNKTAKRQIDKKAIIEKNVTLNGNITIKKNTIVKSGTYIEGPVVIGENCVIGPNAYIRKDTIVHDNCTLRGEIVDSVIMQGTKSKHESYIGHSVIGENCNIACGTITADYRHDEKEHTTVIGTRKINTGRKKLGAFLGDNVKTGIGTHIYPGRKIWPGLCTTPGTIIKKDIIR